jgi:hypothetical protein
VDAGIDEFGEVEIECLAGSPDRSRSRPVTITSTPTAREQLAQFTTPAMVKARLNLRRRKPEPSPTATRGQTAWGSNVLASR